MIFPNDDHDFHCYETVANEYRPFMPFPHLYRYSISPLLPIPPLPSTPLPPPCPIKAHSSGVITTQTKSSASPAVLFPS